MFERFTEKAIKVIMLAQEEARRLGHNYVGTEFILLGLIGEGTGIAAKTLKSRGLNLKDIRVQVEMNVGRGSGFNAIEIPFTPQAKRLLEASWRAARELNHNYIGTEHLLLGLLYVGDDNSDHAGNEAIKILSAHPVSLVNLKTETIEAAKKAASKNYVSEAITKPKPESTMLDLSSADTSYVALAKALKAIRHAKQAAIRSQEFELAAWLREREMELVSKVREANPNIKEVTEEVEPVEKIFQRFSEHARKAYELAGKEAHRSGHNFIGTEQILVGRN